MKHRGILIISVTLTVFVLSAVGGIARTSVLALQMENAGLKTSIAKMQATYIARDSAYQKVVNQANQEIAKANVNLKGMVDEVNVLNTGESGTQTPSAVQSAPGQVPADIALVTARAVAVENSQLAKNPEVVIYEGVSAYEVAFDTGMIYIDALNGNILFNGTLSHEINKDFAAQIAKSYLGGDNVVTQTEKITVNGKILWRSIFSAGHMVYVDTSGQVVYVQMSNTSGG